MILKLAAILHRSSIGRATCLECWWSCRPYQLRRVINATGWKTRNRTWACQVSYALKSPGDLPAGRAGQMQAGRNVVSSSPHGPHLVFPCAGRRHQSVRADCRLEISGWDTNWSSKPDILPPLGSSPPRVGWARRWSFCFPLPVLSPEPTLLSDACPCSRAHRLRTLGRSTVRAGSYGDRLGDGTFGGGNSIGKLTCS